MLDDLLKTLAERGIEPIGAEGAARSVHTEHRVVSSLTEQVSGDGLLLGVGIEVGTVGSQTPTESRENPKVGFTSGSEPEGTYARELSPRTMRFLQNTHSDINRNLLSAYRPISENFANQLTEHGFQPAEISSMTSGLLGRV